MNLRDKISSWMYNRYGLDKLSYALLITYGILGLINLFVKSMILSYISVPIIVCVFFRLSSKNIAKRQMENSLFEKYFNRIKAFLLLERRRVVEIKTHRFRRCPNCNTVLRLKRKTGTHKVECPKCHQEMSVKIWM